MTEDGPGQDKKTHGVSRFLSIDRWKSGSRSSARARSGSNAEEPVKNNNDAPVQNFKLNEDVVDFLKPSTSRTLPVTSKTPRIDIAAAQKWASTTDGAENATATPSSIVRKDHPRRALKLTVDFKTGGPEVIGEGGDESDIPVADISMRLQQRGGQPEHLPLEFLRSEGNIQPDATRGFSESSLSEGTRSAVGMPKFASNDHGSSYRHLIKANPHGQPEVEDDEPEFIPKPVKRQPNHFNSTEQAEDTRPSLEISQSYEPPSTQPSSRGGRKEPWQFVDSTSVMDLAPNDVTNRLKNGHLPNRKQSDTRGFSERFHDVRGEVRQSVRADALQSLPRSVRRSTSTTSLDLINSTEEQERKTFTQHGTQDVAQSRASMSSQASYHPIRQSSGMHKRPPSPSHDPAPHPDTSPRPSISTRKPIGQAPKGSQFVPERTQLNPLRTPPSPPRTLNRVAVSGPAHGTMEQAGKSPQAGYGLPDPFSAPESTPPTSSTMQNPPTIAPLNSESASPSAQAIVDDFVDRCSHMGGIFRLQAEYDSPIFESTPMQWLRAASWWFLKGRLGIEGIVRSRPRDDTGRPSSRQVEHLSQPHVDLAKVWFILTDFVANHPSLRPSQTSGFVQRGFEARTVGDNYAAKVFEDAAILMANLRAVLGSMKRNNIMPPTHALIQGQDQTIWVRCPGLSPTIGLRLSGKPSRTLTDGRAVQELDALSVMAVTDTSTDFSYNRVFVSASLCMDGKNAEGISLPVLVSVMRARNDWHPKVTICTQRELLTICVQGDRERGPSWQDVKWSGQTSSILVQLPHGYRLDAQLPEPDFRQLFNLYNQAYRVQTSLLPHSDERVVHEVSLRDFEYTDSRNPSAFPPERMKRCRIRIFEKAEVRTEGHGQRRFFRGYRLLAVTSPKNRILCSASHELGVQYSTIMEYASDQSNDGAPAIKLYIQEELRRCSLLMVFNGPNDREGFYSIINSTNIGPEETKSAALRLRCIDVERTDQAGAFTNESRIPLGQMQWQELLVVNKAPENADRQLGQTILSENLRIIARATQGTWTDRMNLGPGELLIRLPTNGHPRLMILRPQQDDLSLTLDPASTELQLLNLLSDIQRTVWVHPTIRTYSFHSLEDLHVFQTTITGFVVQYDGIASTFSVARRRSVPALTKHKKLEAATARIQIVHHHHLRTVQLLAFFDDFPQTEAINFQLKGVDVFERSDGKYGKEKYYGVKFVDAKFSLPKMEKEERGSAPSEKPISRKFVSLDLPEVPAENDDVVIGFGDENEREKFIDALPAPAQVARGLTLKRRV